MIQTKEIKTLKIVLVVFILQSSKENMNIMSQKV